MTVNAWIKKFADLIAPSRTKKILFQEHRRCEYCSTEIREGDQIVFCPLCRVVLHVVCAQVNNRKCPSWSCSGEIEVKPRNIHIVVSGSNAKEVEFVAGSILDKVQSGYLLEKNNDSKIKILFLAANPTDTTKLKLDEELRAIDLALRQTDFRDKFEIKQHWAVRVADLQGCLLRHKPDIVHFCGHGSINSEVILKDSFGRSHPVSTHALSKLFSMLKDNIRCVLLNACYTEKQAQAIAEHIDCVIGMSKAIGDLSAISFATAFYQAIGYGKDIKTAFDLGCMQIDLENLGEPETPKLLAFKCNPKQILFVLNE